MRTETEMVKPGWLIAAMLLAAALIGTAWWAVLHLPPRVLEDAHRG